MTDTSAQLTAKGLQNTGITEDLARTYYRQLGTTGIAIVEYESTARSETADGKQKVQLRVITIEPAPDAMTSDHLRELARAFHYERALDDDQLPLDGPDAINPKVGDVVTAGTRYTPHPFIPVDAADDNPICDVCGVIKTATTLHESLDEDERNDEPDQDQPPLDAEPDTSSEREPTTEPESPDELDNSDTPVGLAAVPDHYDPFTAPPA